MKLITAIVKPEKLDDATRAAMDAGAHGMTVTEVRGFGQQYGRFCLDDREGLCPDDPAGHGSGFRSGFDSGFDSGFGSGLREGHRAGFSAGFIEGLIMPKLRIDVVVEDQAAELVACTIAKAVTSGEMGDGKIWVCPVESVIRVRTGERDSDAI